MNSNSLRLIRFLAVEVNFRIVNVIASTKARGLIDIEELSQRLTNAQYNPEMFPGLVYRRLNKPTIIMFASGKITSHGAKSESKAKRAILEVLAEIQKYNCIIGKSEIDPISIENVVGSGSVSHNLDLINVNRIFLNSSFNPSRFPGLVWRPSVNSMVCLIFSTGKIVIAGSKSEIAIKRTFRRVKKALKKGFE